MQRSLYISITLARYVSVTSTNYYVFCTLKYQTSTLLSHSITANMLEEINATASFIVNIVKRQPRHDELTQEKIDAFSAALVANMAERFAPTWDASSPLTGSANRCIRINFGYVDSVILDSAKSADIGDHVVRAVLPSDLTLWCDPQDVSYRFNERSPLFTIFSPKLTTRSSPPSISAPSSPTFISSPIMSKGVATVGAV